MLRKILTLVLSLLFVTVLCGCAFTAPDTSALLSPPALPSELAPIAKILTETAGENYTLKYPSRGAHRSAIIGEDIDGDNKKENFAFYYTSDDENGYMHINAIVNTNGTWKSVATQKIVAGGVDKIEFCDINADGKKEILVGWQIYRTSEMQLAVYSLDNNTLHQILLQRYTQFITCDLDSDARLDVLLVSNASSDEENTASLYTFKGNRVDKVLSCPLDSTSKTFLEPIISPLSNGKPAAYIDEIKGAGAVTEVLFVEDGKLKNPLYSPSFKETLATLRSVSLTLDDINKDGILEIPIQENVPSVTFGASNELLYLTSWCSFSGQALTVEQTAMINLNDGYSYAIPATLMGKIAILKDTTARERGIFTYNPKTLKVGDLLLNFKSFSLSDWKKQSHKTEYFELSRTEDTVHACTITEKGKQKGLTIEAVASAFRLYQ